jgi:RNA polymerase sigma-70 factor, ECF subfamily
VTSLEAAFADDERLLWALSYRMTGVAADADELVQETFLRALERPPRDADRPLRPWLVRVCVNLARDRLRARRRRAYVGPWLPAPVEVDAPDPVMRESARSAYLLALEALTPTQRAVVLLRDVFDYSAAETAAALDTTEAAVRVAHHRARRALAAHPLPAEAPAPETIDAIVRFFTAIGAGDVAGAVALLAPDARLLNDSAGEFLAARMPVVGAEKVVRFLLSVATRVEGVTWSFRTLNGEPALVLESPSPDPRHAPRSVVRVSMAEGRIAEMQWVLASGKLTALG